MAVTVLPLLPLTRAQAQPLPAAPAPAAETIALSSIDEPTPNRTLLADNPNEAWFFVPEWAMELRAERSRLRWFVRRPQMATGRLAVRRRGRGCRTNGMKMVA